jgi:hypothetical protein
MRVIRPLVAAAVAAAVVTACAQDRSTPVEPAFGLVPVAPRADDGVASPNFLAADSSGPQIANPVVQFWATKGEDRTGTMYYHRASGGRDSIPLFALRVRPRSLLRRPDGSAIASGDSVLITLTLVDPVRLIVDCQPAGLRFDPKDPARLRMSFEFTDDDVNDDGVVNATDSTLTRTFAIWRHESEASPWQRQLSSLSLSNHEVETDVGGFTGYAIAW